jgi:hypothetical protein
VRVDTEEGLRKGKKKGEDDKDDGYRFYASAARYYESFLLVAPF